MTSSSDKGSSLPAREGDSLRSLLDANRSPVKRRAQRGGGPRAPVPRWFRVPALLAVVLGAGGVPGEVPRQALGDVIQEVVVELLAADVLDWDGVPRLARILADEVA